MKLVPALFLVALSITHLIYVIAVPGIPNAELERAKTRAVAAMIRFHKSKRYAPVRFPSCCASHRAAHIRNYIKDTRIMTTRFFSSTKERFETRIADLPSVLLKYLPSGLPKKTHSRCNPNGNKRWIIEEPVLEKQAKKNLNTIMKPNRRTTGEVQKPYRWPILKVTASAFEAFKQVAQMFVWKMHGIAVVEVSKRTTQSLNETCSQEPQIQLFRKQQEEGVAWSKYIPVPSVVPSH